MKNKFLYLTFILVFTILGSSTVFAQASKSFRQMGPKERAEVRTEILSQRVELSQEQESSIKEIYTKYAKQRFALKREMKDTEVRKSRLIRLRQSEIGEVKAVLNVSQTTIYTEILEGKAPKLRVRTANSSK